MYDSILIPYDGSDEGDLGAQHGTELAAAVGATVHALYVIDLPGAPRTVYVRDDEEELREEYRSYGEEVTGDVSDMAAELGVETVTAMRTGTAAREIANYADENDIDLIVMGSAYRGKLGGILGGATEKVVRISSVPVLAQRASRDQ